LILIFILFRFGFRYRDIEAIQSDRDKAIQPYEIGQFGGTTLPELLNGPPIDDLRQGTVMRQRRGTRMSS
jgi:hypothetical protein